MNSAISNINGWEVNRTSNIFSCLPLTEELYKGMSELDDQQIVDSLKSGDEEVFQQIYKDYRDSFAEWATYRFTLDRDDALDIFQEALVALFDNAVKGKLTELKVTLKTYIYAIAKNLIYKKHRSEKRTFHQENPEDSMKEVPMEELELEEDEATLRERKVMEELKNMKEPCQSILKLFYLRSYSMEEMAEELGYKNTATMKTTKMRCLKDLRKKVAE